MQSTAALDARGRWRARLAEGDITGLCDESGVWAACREAARAGDVAFLDEVAAASVTERFDDELPAAPGVQPSERVRGLVAVARLAIARRTRPHPGDAAGARARWAALVAEALDGVRAPGAARWVAPEPAERTAGPATVEELLAALRREAPTAAFAVLDDLLADIDGSTPGGTVAVRVPLARAAGRGLGLLAVRTGHGAPGLALDATRAPLLRWDAAFQRAIDAAWWATGRPDRPLRWCLLWEHDGRPVELVEGPSIGLGLAAAVNALLEPSAWIEHDDLAFTGAIDEAGEVGSLLPGGDDVTTAYRDKLRAVADAGRRLALPEADRAAVDAAVGRLGLAVELLGLEHLDGLRADDRPAVLDQAPICPYKGLEPFGQQDAGWFHGRERQIAELAALLLEHPLVGVLGASGAGKSSMTRAGLLPALAAGAVAGSDRWAQAVCTPGTDPWASLFEAIDAPRPGGASLLGGPAHTEAIPEGTVMAAALVAAVRERLAAAEAAPLLLVIDQFEELFTLAPEAAPHVLAALAEAAQTVGRLRIVPVIRADFYGEVCVDAAFARLLSDHHVLVGPMTAQELRRVVTAPAAAAGLVLERALVATVLDDVAAQPTALPHLSTALRETWARRQGRTLTLAGYQAAGGVQNAIAQLADRLYTESSEEDQPRLRRLILQLVGLGEDRLVRRRAGVHDLARDAEDRRVLEALARARIITVSEGGVELTHDAVLSFWPLLGTWLEESREQLLSQRKLARAAQEWDAEGRHPDALLRGAQLLALSDALADDDASLSGLEAAYLEASRAAERAGREAAERTNRRLRRRLAATSVALVLALVGAAAFAWQRRQASEHESAATAADAARERVEQAVLAQSTLQGDSRARTALLSLGALANGPNFEAVVGLGSALSTFDRPIETATVHADDVETAVVSLDGRLIASGSWDGSVRVSDALTAAPLRILPEGDATPRSVALSPSGDRVAAVFHCDPEGACDRHLHAWDADTGELVVRVDTGVDNVAVAFAGDGRLAVADEAGVSVYGTDGTPVRRVGAAELGLTTITALTGDGNGRLAAGDLAGRLAWWQVDGGPVLTGLAGSAAKVAGDAATGDAAAGTATGDATAGTATGDGGEQDDTAAVSALRFSGDGGLLAVGDKQGAIVLFDAASGAVRGPDPVPLKAEEVPPLALDAGQAVLTIAFDPAGGRLAAAGGSFDKRVGGDNDVRVWSLPDQRRLRRLVGGSGPVRGVGFRSDGRVLAVGAERRVRVFESAAGEQLWQRTLQPRCAETGWLNPSSACWLTSVAFVAEDRMVVTGWDKTVAVLDADGAELTRQAEVGASAETPHWSWSRRLAVDATGARVAIGTDRGGVQLWRRDGDALTMVGELPGRTGEDGEPVLVNQLAFDPAGARLATSDGDGSVRVWDLAPDLSTGTVRWSGRHGAPVWSLPNFVNQISWSPDGTRLVSAGGDARVRLWQAADGRELAVTEELPYVLNAAAWSPDGSMIVSGGGDGEIRVWDGELRLQRKFYFDTTAIVTVAFNRSSTLAVITDQAKLVRVVDLTSGRQVAAFPLDTQPTDAIFSPDERQIIATDKDGKLTAFSGPAEWPAAACRLAGRNLTVDEWRLYISAARPYLRLCPDLPVAGGDGREVGVATGLGENLVASFDPQRSR